MEKKRSGWRLAAMIAGIGCLSIIAVIVGGVIIASMYARATLRNMGDSEPRSVSRRIELPSPEPVTAERGPSGKDRPATAPLRLTLDLKEGNFTIRPGQPGTDVQVEGQFSPGMYELLDNRETDPATGATQARIRFRSTAPPWARFFAGITGDSRSQPELTITIPRGKPLDLMLIMSIGRSDIDLGGLTLSDVSVNTSMGEHHVDFREPVAAGARELRFTTSMGNVVLENLGNARAESISGSGSMGNLTVNLSGAWLEGHEANVRFEQSMGELTVRVPANIRVDADVRSADGGESTNRTPEIRQPDDPKAPTVRLRVSTSMGNARVVQY